MFGYSYLNGYSKNLTSRDKDGLHGWTYIQKNVKALVEVVKVFIRNIYL